MNILLVLSLIIATGTQALVYGFPRGRSLKSHGDDENTPNLIPIQAEAARSLMANWCVTMLEREGVYPQCSFDSCYDAIQVIGKRNSITSPENPFLVFTYTHKLDAPCELLISHVLMCVLNTDKQVLYTYGIVENPDNIDYQKSVIPMIEDLTVSAMLENCTVEIEPLLKWAYGVYHFALTRDI